MGKSVVGVEVEGGKRLLRVKLQERSCDVSQKAGGVKDNTVRQDAN